MRQIALLPIMAIVVACGGKPSDRDTPLRVEYASYEDCILGKLGRGQSTVASDAIIAACRAKHPLRPAVAAAQGESESGTFHGFECTDDCSGHQAGFDWAETRGISDAAYCGGYSQSFTEGCIAYARQGAR